MAPRTTTGETVKNVVTYPVDLKGGRVLGVGETAENVGVTQGHNHRLVLDGQIAILQDGKKTTTADAAPTGEVAP